MSRAFISLAALSLLVLAACSAGAEDTAEIQQPAPVAAPAVRVAAQPPAYYAPPMTVVPEGTVLEVKLDSALSSGKNRTGDVFTATVTRDVVIEGRRAIPTGSTVHGIVKSVTPAKQGAGKASLDLAFTSLEVPDEDAVQMIASFSDQTGSRKKRNAAIIGGSAAGGALLGRLIGKDTKGAVVGAVAGGAVGTGVALSKEGDQVKLPAGSALALQLDQSVRVPRR